jgi:hypothetical protein
LQLGESSNQLIISNCTSLFLLAASSITWSWAPEKWIPWRQVPKSTWVSIQKDLQMEVSTSIVYQSSSTMNCLFLFSFFLWLTCPPVLRTGLRLGNIVPDFSCSTTHGEWDSFHEWKKGEWNLNSEGVLRGSTLRSKYYKSLSFKGAGEFLSLSVLIVYCFLSFFHEL